MQIVLRRVRADGAAVGRARGETGLAGERADAVRAGLPSRTGRAAGAAVRVVDAKVRARRGARVEGARFGCSRVAARGAAREPGLAGEGARARHAGLTRRTRVSTRAAVCVVLREVRADLQRGSGVTGTALGPRVAGARRVRAGRQPGLATQRAGPGDAREAGCANVAARAAVPAVVRRVDAERRAAGVSAAALGQPGAAAGGAGAVGAHQPAAALGVAVAAVGGVESRVDARRAAFFRSAVARERAGAVLAGLARSADGAALPAVGGVLRQVDAGAAALGRPGAARHDGGRLGAGLGRRGDDGRGVATPAAGTEPRSDRGEGDCNQNSGPAGRRSHARSSADRDEEGQKTFFVTRAGAPLTGDGGARARRGVRHCRALPLSTLCGRQRRRSARSRGSSA